MGNHSTVRAGILVLAGIGTACSGGGGDAGLRVGFMANASQVGEGESAHVELRLEGSGAALTQELRVELAVAGSGSASAGADFVLDGASATFPVGSAAGATAEVVFAVVADGIVEADEERAQLSLTGGTAEVGVDGGARHELTIREGDRATLEFASAQSTTPDESGGPFAVRVRLALPPGGALATDVSAAVVDTLGGDASSGADYEAFAAATVAFAPGDADGSERSVQLVVQPDLEIEGLEHVMLALENASALAELGANATHELAIADDELGDTPTLIVLADEGDGAGAVENGELLSFGTQHMGDAPDPGVLVRLENMSLATLALSVATLTGDGGDFSIELEEADGGSGELPAVVSFPFAATAEHALQGVGLELDEARLAALEGRERIVLTGVPMPGGEDVALELERVPSPWSPGASLRVDGRAVELAPLLAGASAWRGRVVGEAASELFLSFSRHGSHGWIRRADGALVLLVSERESSVASRGPRARLVPNDLLEGQVTRPVTLECAGVRGEGSTGSAPQSTGADDGPTVGACALALETDFQLFQRFGTLAATVNYVTALTAAVSARYRVDAQAELAIGYLGIYTNSNDPWSTPDGGGDTGAMLDEFQSAWTTDGWPVAADLAHFVSGANLGGGIAYLSVLCNDTFGFGVSANINGGIDWEHWDGNPSSLAWDFVVLAHELGHNFGSHHTHTYCPPLDQCTTNCNGSNQCSPGTIMSYCHLCGGTANLQLEFHPHSANIMRTHVAASCFGGTLLTPAASTLLRVRFEPYSGAGQKQASLRFTHDADNVPSPFELELEGTALE